tara:strand:- start:11 stop:271 length:261 start_codon:yes stop_codon:yes gene_type:complete
MKRVIVFTSSNLRHQALVKILKESNKLIIEKAFYEKGNILQNLVDKKEINILQKNHLIARDQSEEDTFGIFIGRKREVNFNLVNRG